MTDLIGKCGPKKAEAILALLANRSIESAAEACEISPRTLHRWLAQPEFQKAYAVARHQAFSQSMGQLQLVASKAVAALLEIVAEPATPASARIRAAEILLENAFRSTEIETFESRISQLEELADHSKKSRYNS